MTLGSDVGVDPKDARVVGGSRRPRPRRAWCEPRERQDERRGDGAADFYSSRTSDELCSRIVADEANLIARRSLRSPPSSTSTRRSGWGIGQADYFVGSLSASCATGQMPIEVRASALARRRLFRQSRGRRRTRLGTRDETLSMSPTGSTAARTTIRDHALERR